VYSKLSKTFSVVLHEWNFYRGFYFHFDVLIKQRLVSISSGISAINLKGLFKQYVTLYGGEFRDRSLNNTWEWEGVN